jgi:hypothetical protein
MKRISLIVVALLFIASMYAFKEMNPVDPGSRYVHPDATDNDDYSTLYVDDDYNSGTAGWGETHHDNIQDAIDRAVKITVAYSATEEPAGIPVIYVEPGEYMGCFLTKPVKIIGDTTTRPIINDGTMDHGGVKANPDVGTMPTAFNCNDGSKTVNAHFSEIKNFVIEFPRTGVNSSDSRLPIYLKNCNYIEIANCDISYCNQSITMWGCAHSDIHDNIINYPTVGGAINGGGIGIWIGSSGSGLLCQYNEIYNNTVNGSAPGDYSFSVNGIAGGCDYRYASSWDIYQTFSYNKFYDNVVLGTYEPDARCFEFALLYDSSPAIPFTVYPTEPGDTNYETSWDDMYSNEVYGNLFDGTHDPVYFKYGWKNKFYNNTVYSSEYGLSISQDQVEMYCSFNNITPDDYAMILYSSATRDIDATLNYFGTMDSTAIEAIIYHNGLDGAGSGLVTYYPCLEKAVKHHGKVETSTATAIGDDVAAGGFLYIEIEDADLSGQSIDGYIIGNPNNPVDEITIGATDYMLSPVYWGVNPSESLSFDIDVYYSRLDQMLDYTGTFSLVSRIWDDVNDVWGDWTIETATAGTNSFGLTLTDLAEVMEFAVIVEDLAAEIDESTVAYTPDTGSGESIGFDWDAGVAPGATYIVYSSDDPFEDLGEWDPQAATRETSFDYTIPEGEDYLFFTVVIEDGENLNDPSEVVGFFKYHCSVEATTNINLISLPLLPVDPDTEDSFMASEFIDTYINNDGVKCNTISYWDRYTQSWVTASYLSGFGWGGDFEMAGNGAYMIGVTESFEVTIYGTLPGAQEGYLVISETTNANMIMLPLNEMSLADDGDGTLTITEVGDELCENDGSVNHIAYWSNSEQSWKSIIDLGENWGNPTYQMQIGIPYMFFPTEYIAWPSSE